MSSGGGGGGGPVWSSVRGYPNQSEVIISFDN